ncbi:hypothetical protein LCGC14_0876790 [marine sediment metagenome]|uniref:Beta-lactamase-related domain-containing protein n=1 Tax=marine sediment metagenome TaxID=412755 RepID=A0A0F9P815_9ZZZZ
MIGSIVGNPEKVDMTSSGLGEVIKSLENQVTQGLHTGAQLHVARRGETVLNIAVGEAQPGVPINTDSVLLLWSSGKPWTSVAIAQLLEKEKIKLSQTIQSFIPEFKNGKESCTIRHVLIHAGGFPMLTYSKWLTASPEELLKDACNEKAEYKPGTQCGYHPRMAWIILGEIVRRVDGRRIEDYLKEEIFVPLGMNSSFMGMTRERALNIGNLLALKDSPDPSEKKFLWVNDFKGRIFPGSTGYSSASDMGKFYKALWNGGEWNGNRILQRKTVEYITATHRRGIADLTFSTPEMAIVPDYGLGFSKGKSNSILCSRDAFGHGGRSSCINFCDPKVNLIINFNSNTMLPIERNIPRGYEIISKIYNSCRA